MWRSVRHCPPIHIQSASGRESSLPCGFCWVNHSPITQTRGSQMLSPSLPFGSGALTFWWATTICNYLMFLAFELGAPCWVQCSRSEYLGDLSLLSLRSGFESCLCYLSILLNICFVIDKRRMIFILEVRQGRDEITHKSRRLVPAT